MPSTVSSVIDTVRLRVDHSSLSDTQILDLVNKGQRRLQREAPFVIQEARVTGTISAVTAGAQLWTPPTDMRNPFNFYFVESGVQRWVRFEAYFHALEEYAGATTAMRPEAYSFYATAGYLWPALTSAIQYEFYYDKLLADFTGATASNDFLNQAPEVLEDLATAEYYDTIAEAKRAEVWRKKGIDAVAALIKQSQFKYESGQSAVPNSPGTIRRAR